MSCDTLCETPFEYCVEQGGTVVYRATLTKPDASPVLLSELDSLTLRLTNQADGEIINDRDEVDVLNDHGGVFHGTSGLFTMTLNGLDHPITAAGVHQRREVHVATFEARWGSGAGSKRWIVLATVDNLDNVAGSSGG